jgi:hypothetical protein
VSNTPPRRFAAIAPWNPPGGKRENRGKGEAMYIGGGILTLIVIILLLIWIF